jgi:outer membrane lipoprotein carrier protein
MKINMLSYGGRLIILTAVALVFGPALLAQSSTLSVHELAQRVDRHYNQLRTLKAEFIENYEGLGMHRTESGTLLLMKPGRMKWVYSRPAGKLFVLDGKYAWFYSKGSPHVQRVPSKQLDDLRSPLRFLLGHTQLEKELDHLTMTASANGKFTLTGVPKGQQNRINKLKLTVTANGVIEGIEMEEIDGALTRFSFNGEIPNASIPADSFRFTPPAGVPVVDAMPPV